MKITKKALKKLITTFPVNVSEGNSNYECVLINDHPWYFKRLEYGYLVDKSVYKDLNSAILYHLIFHKEYVRMNYGWEIVDDKEDLG